MFSRLLLLFVLVPAAELFLLIRVGQWIGAMETFGLIVATGLVGSWMARTQGLSVWREFNQKIARGGVPGKELVDGLIILVSGALLLTPGIITDVVGLLGLLPATRSLVRGRLLNWFSSNSRFVVGGQGVGFGGGPESESRPDEQDPGGWSGAPTSHPHHQETR